MPRLTAQSAQARKDDIVAAALRVMARKGVARTSMADIIAESGMSSGSIYSHFSGRAEIGVRVAAALIEPRTDRLFAALEAQKSLDPIEIIAILVGSTAEDTERLSLVVQMWGESTVDPEIREIVGAVFGKLRETFVRAVAPWAEEGGVTPEACADGMLLLAQGFIAGKALGLSDADLRARARSVAAIVGRA